MGWFLLARINLRDGAKVELFGLLNFEVRAAKLVRWSPGWCCREMPWKCHANCLHFTMVMLLLQKMMINIRNLACGKNTWWKLCFHSADQWIVSWGGSPVVWDSFGALGWNHQILPRSIVSFEREARKSASLTGYIRIHLSISIQIHIYPYLSICTHIHWYTDLSICLFIHIFILPSIPPSR